jgi:hypothetical protein
MCSTCNLDSYQSTSTLIWQLDHSIWRSLSLLGGLLESQRQSLALFHLYIALLHSGESFSVLLASNLPRLTHIQLMRSQFYDDLQSLMVIDDWMIDGRVVHYVIFFEKNSQRSGKKWGDVQQTTSRVDDRGGLPMGAQKATSFRSSHVTIPYFQLNLSLALDLLQFWHPWFELFLLHFWPLIWLDFCSILAVFWAIL